MSIETKYLVFKGVDKKEQILFKSFLNLAKNELEYQVVILKEGKKHTENPDIVILDAAYQFTEEEASMANLPTIKVGKEPIDAPGYIVRPVQWSDFKTQLNRLGIDAVSDARHIESPLPQKMEFVIAEMGEPSASADPGLNTSESEPANKYEYELDNLSIDYHSVTNSEFDKAAEDVKGFVAEPVGTAPSAVVLVTDEESGSENSVLIIETNSLDAWGEADTDFEEHSVNVGDGLSESSYVDDEREEVLTRLLESGEEIVPGEVFWNTDGEIYSDREPLMYVKPSRDLVYSKFEPGKWTAALRNKTITKLPLSDDWRPVSELTAYPLSRLNWANTIATKSARLLPDLDAKTDYILEKWPCFELLELDNMLLKLSTMIYVKAESPHSLLQKSGYSRTVVYGFINACHELGILFPADEFDLEQYSQLDTEESMFGKIKDVFRN